MKKFFKYIIPCAVALMGVAVASCSDDDDLGPVQNDYNINYAYVYQPNSTFAQLEYKKNGEFLIDINDPLKLMPVRSTKPAPVDVNVKIEIDPSLVEVYNKEKGTDYVLLEGATVITPNLVIPSGKYVSPDSIVVTFDHQVFQSGETNYILPVAITSAAPLTISKSNVIYLTFTSNYRANLVSTPGQRYLTITNDPDIEGWETANTNVTIENFVMTNWAADEAIPVSLEIDPSLIESYNGINGTTFKPLDATLVTSTITIAQGAQAANLSLTLGDYTGVVDGEEYLIPIRLTVDETTGAAVAETSKIAYVQVILLPLSIESAIGTPSGMTALTPNSNWVGTAYTINYGDEDFTDILMSNSSYYGSETDDVWEIDLAETTQVRAVSFQFYNWYFGWADLRNIETSIDCNNWSNWGDVSFTRYSTNGTNQYIIFSKPAKFRYLRFTCGDYGYSADYGTFVRNIKFWN